MNETEVTLNRDRAYAAAQELLAEHAPTPADSPLARIVEAMSDLIVPLLALGWVNGYNKGLEEALAAIEEAATRTEVPT